MASSELAFVLLKMLCAALFYESAATDLSGKLYLKFQIGLICSAIALFATFSWS